jgi:hypothetical protein
MECDEQWQLQLQPQLPQQLPQQLLQQLPQPIRGSFASFEDDDLKQNSGKGKYRDPFDCVAHEGP